MQPLLFTTATDLSAPYFEAAGWQIFTYAALPASLPPAQLVYFRDPFNDPDFIPDSTALDHLISHYAAAQSVDHIRSFRDMLSAEDKYLQSRRLGDLYPVTHLPSQRGFTPGRDLAKPRISQRAKNILFDLGDRQLDDSWLIQPRLDIQEELRVYTIGHQILDLASIKSSKSTGAVKVTGTRQLTPAEHDFIAAALKRCNFDLIGFDLACLTDDTLTLIEVNRSPQFRRYTELTGTNLAQILTDHLTAR